jgi:hemerythrin-like domain-containing protein
MTVHQDLDQRTGWPDELCALLKEYPRASWQQNMTPLARFWIDKHDGFRNQCSTLQTAAQSFRERPEAFEAFANEVTSRTQLLLSHLHGHHQIEDFHYFPAFRAADQRLGPGFDVLARDHELLHKSSMTIVETLNEIRDALREDGPGASDDQRRAADRYIEESGLLCRRIGRHLDDEEDLVIPLMLAHG